jgi:predicted RNA-binding Zn ribbon-like protein
METQTPIDQMPLVGGTLAFDFLNTRGGSPDAPLDLGMRDFADLVAWSRHAGTLTERDGQRLARQGHEDTLGARAVHAHALEVRAYLGELFGAIHQGREPSEASLRRLRDDEASAIGHARLVEGDTGFDWSWAADDGLARPLWPVVHAAATLLMGGRMERAKRCAGCAWWFLDETRNGSRRWCRMEDCGTDEKIRRYVSRRAARRASDRPLGDDRARAAGPDH